MPRTFIRAQSASVLPNDEGAQSAFFTASSSRVASTYPVIAAPKQGNPARTGCTVIVSGRQTGTRGGILRPSAAQFTTRASSATATEPSAKSIRPRRTVSMWPRRTTFSMVRSCSSSHLPRVGALAMVGVTDRSMRNMMPRSSSARNSAGRETAVPAARIMSATMPR
ncbi:hypothetical protein [Nocardioides panacis]|uniref:hypothetical protein n=1 Tax=Nocardioides panacis TaxID=2849501 RepID=UPI0020B1ED95|nr:hypothetical protein [Nocardioides panacis]